MRTAIPGDDAFLDPASAIFDQLHSAAQEPA
jgi:hypothetical protein